MYYVSLFIVGIIVMFIPLGVSFVNSASTSGLRVLCGLLCALNAALITIFILLDSPTVLNVLLYMVFILLSMDVALRKVPTELDTPAQ